MNDREKTIAFEMNYCQHYDTSEPLNSKCAAGMDIQATRIKGGKPCIGGHELPDPLKACPHWLRHTREQGEARADRVEESMRRMRLVMPVVAEWRKKPPRGKQEVIECPACKGRLHLSQAAYNGHVWGKCETEGCVNWME